MSVVVVYHTKTKSVPCFNGLCAASLLWCEFGNEASYFPVSYSTPVLPLSTFANKRVYFVDFSYPIDYMDRVLEVSNFLLVLGHTLGDVADRSYLSNSEDVSASILTWRYLHASEPVPRFVQLIDAGARFCADPDLEAFNSMLAIQPASLLHWSSLIQGSRNDPDFLKSPLELGTLLKQYAAKHVEVLSSEAFHLSLGGCPGLAVNANKFYAHLVAVELASKSKTFGAAFHVRSDGQIEVSLRKCASSDLDLSEIARSFGGGGLPSAASFSVSFEKFRELMNYETRTHRLTRLGSALSSFDRVACTSTYKNLETFTSELNRYLLSCFDGSFRFDLHTTVSTQRPNVVSRALVVVADFLGLPNSSTSLRWYHKIFPYVQQYDFQFDEDAIREVLVESATSGSDFAVNTFLVEALIGSVEAKPSYRLERVIHFVHVVLRIPGCSVPVKHTFRILR